LQIELELVLNQLLQEVLLFKELFSKRIVLCCSKRGF